MKYNKLFLGLSVAALTLFSGCSDDPEYTPASPVTTPAAYFDITEETTIDLEETSTDFFINIYRADKGDELTIPVTTELKDENGAAVASGLFNYPSSVTFEKGSDVAEYKVSFNINDLEPMLTYDFDLKLNGEATPYFTTSNKYEVAYIPWQVIPNSKIYDFALLTWSTLPEAEIWEVMVQEHPKKKGFFRIKNAYDGFPIGTWRGDASKTDYLYINATKADEVYFSDSKGNPSVFYYTNVYIFDGMGQMVISCPYSSFLNSTPLAWGDKLYDYKQFSTWTAKYVVENKETGQGYVDFGTSIGIFIEGFENGPQKSRGWQLRLNGSEGPKEWADMGQGQYTDGFLGEDFFEEEAATYPVPVQQNIKNKNLYKIVQPYAAGTWPLGDASAKAGDMIIDVSDPDFVMIELQEIYSDAAGQLGACNAAAMYTYGYIDKTLTRDEIINQGLNDTFKDGVISINHPAVLDYKQGQIYFLWNDPALTPGKLILPTEEEAAKAAAAPAETYRIPGKNAGKHKLSNKKTLLDGPFKVATLR